MKTNEHGAGGEREGAWSMSRWGMESEEYFSKLKKVCSSKGVPDTGL